jgi:hypothetical protein
MAEIGVTKLLVVKTGKKEPTPMSVNPVTLSFPKSLLGPLVLKAKTTHSLTHAAEPFLSSRQLYSYSRTSQHFMEPEGSLLCSQEHSIGLFLSQINSIHTVASYLSKILLYCPSTYVFVSLVVSCLLAFPPIIYKYSSSPLFLLHTLPISSSLTSSFECYLEKSPSYEAPHYVVFSLRSKYSP